MWEQVGITEGWFSVDMKSRMMERNKSLGKEHSKKKKQEQSNNEPGRLEISKKEEQRSQNPPLENVKQRGVFI